MASDIPWDEVVSALDYPQTNAAANNAIHEVLLASGEDAGILASRLAPMVKALSTGNGRELGAALLAPYLSSSAPVRDMIIALSEDEAPNVRLVATRTLISAAKAGDNSVLFALFKRLGDVEPTVKNVALQAVPQLAAAPTGQVDALALYVLPDSSRRDEALDLLDKLRSAVRTLQDLGGLDDSQNRIIDEVIFPTIDLVRGLLAEQLPTQEATTAGRGEAVSGLGQLAGASKALTTAAAGVSVTANFPAALDNVGRAAHAVQPVISWLLQYV